MPNVALVPEYATRIPLLLDQVDGFPEETHKLVTDTGNSPLEDGAIITDHAVAKAEQLELTGYISDQTSEGAARPRAGWDRLRQLHKEVVPLTVVSPLGVYDDMLIIEVVGRRRGNGVRFRMKLENVIRVGLQPRQIETQKATATAIGRDTELPRGRVEPEIFTAPGFDPIPPSPDAIAEATAAAKEASRLAPDGPVSQSQIRSFADFNQFAGLPQIPAIDGLIPTHGTVSQRIDSLASRLASTHTDADRQIRQIRQVTTYRGALRLTRGLPGVNSAFQIVNRFRRAIPF